MKARPDPLFAYKSFLKDAIEKRPSGTRRKLAAAFGTHPSFVSQITNPALKVPLPAQHIPTLFQVCHLTADEQERFLGLYKRAHPAQATSIDELAESEKNVVKIPLPQFDDPAIKAEVIQMIRDFADRLILLADNISKRKTGSSS